MSRSDSDFYITYNKSDPSVLEQLTYSRIEAEGKTFSKDYLLTKLNNLEGAVRPTKMHMTDIYFNRGLINFHLGKMSNSQFEFQMAIILCPKSPLYHYWQAHLFLKLSRFEDAFKEFIETEKLNPAFLDIREIMISSYVLTKPEKLPFVQNIRDKTIALETSLEHLKMTQEELISSQQESKDKEKLFLDQIKKFKQSREYQEEQILSNLSAIKESIIMNQMEIDEKNTELEKSKLQNENINARFNSANSLTRLLEDEINSAKQKVLGGLLKNLNLPPAQQTLLKQEGCLDYMAAFLYVLNNRMVNSDGMIANNLADRDLHDEYSIALYLNIIKGLDEIFVAACMLKAIFNLENKGQDITLAQNNSVKGQYTESSTSSEENITGSIIHNRDGVEQFNMIITHNIIYRISTYMPASKVHVKFFFEILRYIDASAQLNIIDNIVCLAQDLSDLEEISEKVAKVLASEEFNNSKIGSIDISKFLGYGNWQQNHATQIIAYIVKNYIQGNDAAMLEEGEMDGLMISKYLILGILNKMINNIDCSYNLNTNSHNTEVSSKIIAYTFNLFNQKIPSTIEYLASTYDEGTGDNHDKASSSSIISLEAYLNKVSDIFQKIINGIDAISEILANKTDTIEITANDSRMPIRLEETEIGYTDHSQESDITTSYCDAIDLSGNNIDMFNNSNDL